METCCAEKHFCKGMCRKHYNAHYMKTRRASITARQREYRKNRRKGNKF